MSSLTDTANRRKKRGLALRHRRDPDLQRQPARPNRHREAAESPSESSSSVKAQRELPRWFWTLLELLLLGALVFCLVQIGLRINVLQQLREDLSLVSEDLDRKTAELEERMQQATMEVRYLVPGQDDLVEEILYGDYAVLREGTELPGYTFLYWEDREGKPEDRQTFPVYRDTVYTARYALAFESEKHIPYLSTDTEGVLNLSGTVSIREFVNILYLLLDLDRVGDGRFLDVAEDDPCFKAAATLKELGALEGSRLFPDEPLTLGEMLKTLCHFFPVTREQHVFQDMDPDDEYYRYFCTAVENGWLSSGMLVRTDAVKAVTRGDFARIMNHVLHRDAERHLTLEDVGSILDVPPTADYYDDVVEAVIPHQYRIDNDVEIWTESKALPLHEPGFFFAGFRLHYIAEDGTPAANGNFMGLDFNRNGEVTSLDEELDVMLLEILEKTIDPSSMEREEMLKAVYDYVVHNFSYRYGYMKEQGAEGWGAKEAKRMIEDGGGNCYNFSALFYELARFVGYDAKLYAGFVRGDQYATRTEEGTDVWAPQYYTPHGWVEIEIDGVVYIFDTEYEYRQPSVSMFKRGDHARDQFGYMK